ncbi:transcription factor bHLH148 [Heracleum sosnowskyi]|uniref:Transcription factor bHLH148 n=1 Tax=Heracleum sosnowskyi TaxID=360622 RepID=A0AAD8IQR8_9APIA|nr:transcription factor bHLH148 [Heracleum sosnowskyi]
MASTLISNPITSSTRESRKKKKKRSQITQNQSQNPNNNQISWKSDTQQQIYSSKLLQALRHVRLDDSSAPRRGKAVREAADRVLAATAKGKTRWSRAILTNRLKMKFSKNLRRRRVVVPGNGASKSVKKAKVSVLRLKSKNLPAVQRKARFLGRLVPGCRKESLPVVLEEAGDYIAALEMQVRAMAALAELLSGASSSG